jgi:hypothetical protein
MLHQIIGLTAGLISVAAYAIYIYGMWWGNTRPSRSSWWLLTVVWTVIFMSSISVGKDAPTATTEDYLDRALQISYIFGSLIIAISTIWRGSNIKWDMYDYMCAACTAVALALYFVFSAPMPSLIMAVVADIFAILPTVNNSKTNPEHEHLSAWKLELFASALAMFAISSWSFKFDSISLWLPNLYLITANGLIVILIKKGLKQKQYRAN